MNTGVDDRNNGRKKYRGEDKVKSEMRKSGREIRDEGEEGIRKEHEGHEVERILWSPPLVAYCENLWDLS